MQINSIGSTSFGLKFDSYMHDKLNKAKKVKKERVNYDYYSLLNLKKLELA